MNQEISIGIFKGEHRLSVQRFHWKNGPIKAYEMDIPLLQEESLHLLIARPEHLENYAPLLEKEEAFYPVLISSEVGLEEEPATLLSLFKKELGQWTLKNNLSCLEELIPLWEQLALLFKEDLFAFYEELWTILNKNLTATYLRLIFPDLEENTTARQKKLCYRFIEGERKKGPVSLGGEAEKALMEAYTPVMKQNIEIIEWSVEKGELLAVIKLQKGPKLIMMAHLVHLDTLQKSWLKLFFDGLQRFTQESFL